MEPGHVLGWRFVIIGELGKGSMATVYLAEDKIRGTRIALKVLHEHLADDEDARARLTREVRAAGRIQHPNALVAHDIHDLDGRLSLSMPVHRGLTLAELVESDGPLSAEALDQLAQDLSGALAAAHNVGVIHRDVSPNNILVERGGASVLADFGLARVEGHGTKTSTGGTWGYAAPEVFSGSSGDPRSDVYSLGAALYFAATGTAPFAASNPGTILKKQLEGTFTPLAELRPYLPLELVASIEAMLAVDPEHRTQGAREAMDAIVAKEIPNLPAVATAQTELPVGMYTVIVQRVSERRRGRGPIPASEATEPERQLAIAVKGAMPDALPAAVRRDEFKLAEGVDSVTADRLAAESIRAGFAPRIVNDPHVRWSKSVGEWPYILAFFLLMASITGVAMIANDAGPASMILAGSTLASFVSFLGLGLWAGNKRTLRLAFSRDQPQAALPTVTDADPLLRMHAQTDAKLMVLEKALNAEEHVADALRKRISATLDALRARATELVEPARRLGGELSEDTDSTAAVQRIHQRLQRLETLERAGEFVDASERTSLLSGLEAHREAQRQRDEAEVLRTRIAARLLEIGAAATRATRALKRDGDLAGSVRTLLNQLVAETEAAADVLDELEQRPKRVRQPLLN